MIERLVIFFLITMRVAAFFLILPVFGWRAIPVYIKAATVVLLSVFFCAYTPVLINIQDISILHMILWAAHEATYGLALGVIVFVLFAVVRCAGRIIERQMGLAMAEVMDPLTGERTQPLGSLLEMIFILLFLSANGHHLMLLVLSKSLTTFSIGTHPSIFVLAQSVTQAGSMLFFAALRLSAPILAAFLLMLVVLAIMARLVPEMNILFISLPIRVGLGMIMALLFLPFMEEFVAELSRLMSQLLPI